MNEEMSVICCLNVFFPTLLDCHSQNSQFSNVLIRVLCNDNG